jgi:hypothetical protein
MAHPLVTPTISTCQPVGKNTAPPGRRKVTKPKFIVRERAKNNEKKTKNVSFIIDFFCSVIPISRTDFMHNATICIKRLSVYNKKKYLPHRAALTQQ